MVFRLNNLSTIVSYKTQQPSSLAMDNAPTPSRTSTPPLPQEAQDFLDENLADQDTLLERLKAEHGCRQAELDLLQKLHPLIDTTMPLFKSRSFLSAAKAKDTEKLKDVGAEFDARFGKSSMGVWVPEVVMKKLWEERGEILIKREGISRLEYLCANYEAKAEQKDSAKKPTGLEASGEVFEKGSHPD